MGVSFKVARAGTRYRLKLGQIDDRDHGNESLANDSQQRSTEANVTAVGRKDAGHTDYLADSELHLEDFQVSFSLNLFADGFSVGKATEIFNDLPKKLHPYDRASETLFTAIEYGWLPGDVFDDIPCNYINGVLLCEIRDYRNCPSQRPSTVNSPVTHKVLLQMCMENVVKDILSLSDDSWSYEGLLEVESRILKALQPHLNLNPKPLLKKYPGKPLIKKLNLGISWAWKKRKLNDGPIPPTTTTGGSQSQNSNCQSGVGYPDKQVPHSRQAVSVSVQTLQENNITCSQSDPSIVCFPSANSSNRSLGNLPISSAIASMQKQHRSSHESDMREASSLVPAETCRSEIEATQRPVMKIPKQEPLDLSQDQYPESQAAGIDSVYFYQHRLPWIPATSSPAVELLWKNNVSYQNTSSEKDQHAIPYKEGYPFSSIKGGQQAVSEGIPILQDAIPASIVKQEPISEFLRTKDKYNQYNLHSSPLLTANTPSTNSLGTDITHHVRNLRDEAVDQKRKALQKEASAPAKQRKNSCSKGLSVGILDALAGTTNVSAANARNISQRGVHLPPNSEVYGNSLLQRFVKIKGVTQRHQLNNRNCKSDQVLPSKPYSSVFPLVALKLEEDSTNGKQKDLIMQRIPLSKCFIDKRQNVSKTRILIYVHSPHIHHGVSNTKIDREHQIKMLISEKLNENMVEVKLLYGQEEKIDFPLLLTSPNTHFADLFALQFTSLMAHEGYRLVADRVVPNPVNVIHSSSSQQPTVTVSSATQISGRTLELSSSTFNYGPSPTMHSAPTGPMSAGPGGNPLPTLYNQSTLQLPGGTISKLTLDAAAQVSPGLPDWQGILNKRAHLLFLMEQRERLQQQLMQKKLMVERLGVNMSGVGKTQLGGGSQGLGNVGLVPRAPTFSDMAFVLNNQQPPQPLTHQQQILNQRVPLQIQAPASLTEYASSQLTKVGLQQIGQQPRLNHGSASQLTNRGNMVSGPQSPELSSQTQGSVSGSKASSSRNFTDKDCIQ